MSVTKDGDTGRWMSQIRVRDWTGKTIHKKKRGFATKKEALKWERDFISQSTGSLGMTFGDFISLYVKDMEHRLKPSTVSASNIGYTKARERSQGKGGDLRSKYNLTLTVVRKKYNGRGLFGKLCRTALDALFRGAPAPSPHQKHQRAPSP